MSSAPSKRPTTAPPPAEERPDSRTTEDRLPPWLRSFRHAARGVARTVATQRNMRFHMVSAALVMMLGMTLPLGLASRVALLFCVALVLFAEMLNTALEAFVDLHVRSFRKEAMVAKDAAAGGVLVLAVATVAVLAAILRAEWEAVTAGGAAIRHATVLGAPLAGCLVFLLWRAEPVWLRRVAFLAALAVASPLWINSHAPVFSVILGVILLVALAAPPARP